MISYLHSLLLKRAREAMTRQKVELSKSDTAVPLITPVIKGDCFRAVIFSTADGKGDDLNDFRFTYVNQLTKHAEGGQTFEAPHCLGVKPNRRFEIATSITELIAQRYYEEDLRNVIPNAAPRPDLHASSVSCHSMGSSCGVQQIRTQQRQLQQVKRSLTHTIKGKSKEFKIIICNYAVYVFELVC